MLLYFLLCSLSILHNSESVFLVECELKDVSACNTTLDAWTSRLTTDSARLVKQVGAHRFVVVASNEYLEHGASIVAVELPGNFD
jgi:hypothetical protein